MKDVKRNLSLLDPTFNDFYTFQLGLNLRLARDQGPPSGGDRLESSWKIKGSEEANS